MQLGALQIEILEGIDPVALVSKGAYKEDEGDDPGFGTSVTAPAGGLTGGEDQSGGKEVSVLFQVKGSGIAVAPSAK